MIFVRNRSTVWVQEGDFFALREYWIVLVGSLAFGKRCGMT